MRTVVNTLDRLIEAVAPGVGGRRRAARQLNEMAQAELSALSDARTHDRWSSLPAGFGYRAGQLDRKWNDWIPNQTSSGDAELFGSPYMGPRARQMSRDHPQARAIGNAYVRHVVGRGLWPVPRVTRSETGSAAARRELWIEYNRMVRDDFWRWGTRREEVDVERKRTWAMFQRTVERQYIERGGCLIRRAVVKDRDRVNPMALQLIEYEQLDTSKMEHGGREVRGGVELDEFGAAVAYHVFQQHPGDTSVHGWPSSARFESVRIPAEWVSHVFDPERALQTLGATRLHAVLETLRDTQDYARSELFLRKLLSCIGLIFKKAPGGQSFHTRTGAKSGSDPSGSSEQRVQYRPGMTLDVDSNEDVRPFNPTGPASTYSEFMKWHGDQASAGSDLSPESVTRRFEKSYSAAQQGWLVDKTVFQIEREVATDLAWRDCYRFWLDQHILTGRLEGRVPEFRAVEYFQNPDRFSYAIWSGDPFPHVDPVKTAKSRVELIAAGINSVADFQREDGHDPDEKREELAEEIARYAEIGAAHPAAAAPAPAPGSSGGDDEDDPDENEEAGDAEAES